MSDRSKTVECAKHGQGAATFVCQHLVLGVRCGYHCSTRDPSDPWPDAWCSACNEVLEREGAWNPTSEAFADVRLACSGCYEDHRARNETPTGPLRDRGGLSPENWSQFRHAAVHACQQRQDAAIEQWQITSYARWRRDGPRLWFLDPTLPDLVCDNVVVGSWSANTRTWMWAWANDGLEPDERPDIGRLQAFGLVRDIDELHEAHWEAEESAGWEMTAVASELLGAQAIYRAPMGHIRLFLLLRNLRRKDSPRGGQVMSGFVGS